MMRSDEKKSPVCLERSTRPEPQSRRKWTLFSLEMFCFDWFWKVGTNGRTYGQHVRKQWSLSAVTGSAEWIKKSPVYLERSNPDNFFPRLNLRQLLTKVNSQENFQWRHLVYLATSLNFRLFQRFAPVLCNFLTNILFKMYFYFET